MYQISLQKAEDAVAIDRLMAEAFGPQRHGRSVWQLRPGPRLIPRALWPGMAMRSWDRCGSGKCDLAARIFCCLVRRGLAVIAWQGVWKGFGRGRVAPGKWWTVATRAGIR